MLDDLRNSASFLDEEEESKPEEEKVAVKKAVRRKRKGQQFLGLTAQQRFIVSLVLFSMVCLLGFIALYVSGKINFF